MQSDDLIVMRELALKLGNAEAARRAEALKNNLHWLQHREAWCRLTVAQRAQVEADYHRGLFDNP